MHHSKQCSGSRPSCKRCTDRGLPCFYSGEGRSRGPYRSRKHSSGESEDISPPPESIVAQQQRIQQIQQQQQQQSEDITPTVAPPAEPEAPKKRRIRPKPTRPLSIIVPDRETAAPDQSDMGSSEVSPEGAATFVQWLADIDIQNQNCLALSRESSGKSWRSDNVPLT